MTIELSLEELDLMVWLLATDRSVFAAESKQLAERLNAQLLANL